MSASLAVLLVLISCGTAAFGAAATNCTKTCLPGSFCPSPLLTSTLRSSGPNPVKRSCRVCSPGKYVLYHSLQHHVHASCTVYVSPWMYPPQ